MRGDSTDLPDNEQVVVPLSNRDIDDLQRLLSLLAEASIQANAGGGTASTRPDADFIAQAKLILTNRKRRLKHFGRGVFGEPAWEMLLMLYITAFGQRQTVARLSELSGASRSTAIRWIEYLEREKLVGREPHPTDKRTDFVQLTDKGRQKIEAYLSETIATSA